MDYPSYSIYILDNDSEQEHIENLKEWGKNQLGFVYKNDTDISSLTQNAVALFSLAQNFGFGAANNLILKQLEEKSGEFVWLINPDMIVSENALIELVQNNSGLQIQGALTYAYEQRDKLLHIGAGKVNTISATIDFARRSQGKFDYINGGCMLFPTEVLKIAGLFPEEYFLYWEETHWCKMASQKNVALSINHKVKVWDKGSTSIGKGKIAEYYYTRNGLYYKKKFKPAQIPLNIIMHMARMILRLFTLKLNRAYGILLGMIHFIFGKKGKL